MFSGDAHRKEAASYHYLRENSPTGAGFRLPLRRAVDWGYWPAIVASPVALECRSKGSFGPASPFGRRGRSRSLVAV